MSDGGTIMAHRAARRRIAGLASVALPAAIHAQAVEVAPADDKAFELGQIIVTGQRPQGIDVAGATVNAEAIYTFNRNSLDEAADPIPGVSSSNTGGSRNERLIFMRRFDNFQAAASIDGIRVYLPASAPGAAHNYHETRVSKCVAIDAMRSAMRGSSRQGARL